MIPTIDIKTFTDVHQNLREHLNGSRRPDGLSLSRRTGRRNPLC